MNVLTASPFAAKAPVLFAGKKKTDEAVTKNVLSVSGSGSVEWNPDTMTITLSAVEADPKEQSVHQKLSARARMLMEAVKSLGFPVKTQPSYSVQEKVDYNRQTGEQTRDGFVGQYSLQITDKVKKSGLLPAHAEEIRKAAEKNEARMNGPHFSLSPTRHRKAQKSADAKAFTDAKQSAQVVARKGGFRIANEPVEVKIGHVDDYSGGRKGIRAQGAMMASVEAAEPMGGGAPSVFEFKPIEVVSKPVQAVFEILSGKAKPPKKDK